MDDNVSYIAMPNINRKVAVGSAMPVKPTKLGTMDPPS
ncbi:hypothetical protein PBCVMA1E_209R [Paramecium bursaria Chlorella virus MA1E]|nr:hypothetical protein PBCVMA1E_209R [Paramecium bursaria Chlorella virus MA1E]